VHRLIDASLISAERTAALQNKRNPVAAFWSPALARAGGLVRVLNRAGTNVMYGKSLENAMGDCFSALPKQVTAR